MLDVADVFHVHCEISRISTSVAAVLMRSVRGIVILPEQTILRCVSETLIHPTTDAAVVVSVAVKQLLHRVFLELLINACDVSKTLNGRSSAERPAPTARALIVRSGDLALIEPVLVVRYFENLLVLEVLVGDFCEVSIVPKALAVKLASTVL